MEWHGHYDVCPKQFSFSSSKFRQPFGKPFSQRFDLLEFQEQNRLHQRAFINCKAPRTVKRVRLIVTGGAEQRLMLLSCQRWQRSTADVAGWLGNTLKGRETVVANGNAAGIRKQFPANAAASRKDNADQRIAGGRRPGANTTPPKPGESTGWAFFCHAAELYPMSDSN
jgi:hypothetical protein